MSDFSKPMNCSMPGFSVLHYLLEFVQTHGHSVGDAIQPSHPLPPPSFAFSLSQHWGLSRESALHIMWPKYWSFSFSISPFNEYSGLISFRIDWFDLLAVQGTLKNLLQYPNSKALIIASVLHFLQLVSGLNQKKAQFIRLQFTGAVYRCLSFFFDF